MCPKTIIILLSRPYKIPFKDVDMEKPNPAKRISPWRLKLKIWPQTIHLVLFGSLSRGIK